MHWIARVLSAVNDRKDGKEIIELLERYCCKKVVDSDYQGRTGFGIDRIVFTYLDYVLCRDNQSEFKDFQFQFRTSIEHFFPQHPINGENAVDEKNRDSFAYIEDGGISGSPIITRAEVVSVGGSRPFGQMSLIGIIHSYIPFYPL